MNDETADYLFERDEHPCTCRPVLSADNREALEVIAHIVSQANVNMVEGEDGFISRYDMPVGSIHKAIPFLQRHGIVVDEFGAIHGTLPVTPEPTEALREASASGGIS